MKTALAERQRGILREGPSRRFFGTSERPHSFPRAQIRRSAGKDKVVDPKPQIGYQQPMINTVPIFVSIMMMPLSIPEAGHLGM